MLAFLCHQTGQKHTCVQSKLNLCGIRCRNSDAPAKFVLIVKFPCKIRDVGCEVPLDAESCGGLFLLECCDNTPFMAKVCNDRFGHFSTVSDKVVIKFFNVEGVNALANDLVDDDSINSILFPVLLTPKVVIGHGLCMMDESHVVHESSEHNGWNVEASGLVHCHAGDKQYSLLLRTSARCPWHPPQLVVFMR